MEGLNGWVGLLAAAVFLFVLGMQWQTLRTARRMRGQCLQPEQLPQGTKPSASGHLLLYFHSAGCIMCPPVTRIIESLRPGRPWIVPVDARAHLDLARACGVRGTPALVLLHDGCIRQVLVGQKSREAIERLISEVSDERAG
ncbi:MAG: thioredoxin [Gammaproteobacteria bacterium]|nr:MAG: thioredoxin [Gammaproteobacteria bacterium]